MKKVLTFLTSGVIILSLMFYIDINGMQQDPAVENIFTHISHFNRRAALDFQTFPDSPQGLKLIDDIKKLTPAQKTELLKKINAEYNIGYDVNFYFKITLYKILVLAGTDINCDMGTAGNRKTMIKDAVDSDDIALLKFLLDHGARTTDTDYSPRPTLLEYTSSYEKTKLLIAHNALRPYINNSYLQQRLLTKLFSKNVDSIGLINLYISSLKDTYGARFNFKFIDNDGNTLLHVLCLNALTYTSTSLFENKVNILLKEGVDFNARNNQGKRAVDIIDDLRERYPTNSTLKFAHIFLTNLLKLESLKITVN